MDTSKNPSTEPQTNKATTAAVPVKEEVPIQTEESTTETKEVADPTDYDAEGQVPAVASSTTTEDAPVEQSGESDTEETTDEEDTTDDENTEDQEPATAPSVSSQPKTNKTLLIVASTLIVLGVAAGAYGLLVA